MIQLLTDMSVLQRELARLTAEQAEDMMARQERGEQILWFVMEPCEEGLRCSLRLCHG